MTSSAKKKRERKKDFQKPKLKVGKAKPKATNSTDTSFRAKGLVLDQQLSVDAPTASARFLHHISLLSSRSDGQRRDALAFLTNYLSSSSQANSLPLTTGSLLDKLCPLILDGSHGVRSQLLRLFESLPPVDIRDQVPRMLPHVRAGMTHLSKDIRASSTDVLSWLVAVAGQELVCCAGGWYKTLECFTTMLGWRSSEIRSANQSSIGESKSLSQILLVLAQFLEAGMFQTKIGDRTSLLKDGFPFWQTEHHRLPTKSNAYSYLNLFGPVQDEKSQMLEDREDRVRVYNDHFRPLIDAGVSTTKREGGELGRATGTLVKALERVRVDDLGGKSSVSVTATP